MPLFNPFQANTANAVDALATQFETVMAQNAVQSPPQENIPWHKALSLMVTQRAMADLYEEFKTFTSKYVHATSRGHEAIQIAAGLQLKAIDFAFLYYRDDSVLLAIGLKPYELMLQLMAKADDPFSGGRTYYGHPSLKRDGFPRIPHQSAATGMQAIPAVGLAHGLQYLEQAGINQYSSTDAHPVVLCSLGDGSVTEGEVAEALQMATLKNLPVIFLVQDNDWSISAHGLEFKNQTAYEYAAGFKGLTRLEVDGTDFAASYEVMKKAIAHTRERKGPVLVHAKVPLLGHHTSGVRREWYREAAELDAARSQDPGVRLANTMLHLGLTTTADLQQLESATKEFVLGQYEAAKQAMDPDPGTVLDFVTLPSPVRTEQGTRSPIGGEKTLMVDAALHAIDEILAKYPEALLYGQDVGARLGGVFREAATLAAKYGSHRVFNTPIQEAYIVGSTAGMAAAGARPIVEVQFADYLYPAINQLITELSKSCYLSQGKYPIPAVIRVPIGAYGSGGPYHSGSVESMLTTFKGIKVVYPSNAADLKGLMKAAFLDPNPVVMLEHKGLYWSKVPGTEDAKTIEPSADYVLPLGKAYSPVFASQEALDNGESAVVITYGMGVYWAKAAAQQLNNAFEIVDLRTLSPLDYDYVMERVNVHGKALVLTEESVDHSFAESLAGRIMQVCFKKLDAPVQVLGALNVPAIPLNESLEKAVLPNAEKVAQAVQKLLNS